MNIDKANTHTGLRYTDNICLPITCNTYYKYTHCMYTYYMYTYYMCAD